MAKKGETTISKTKANGSQCLKGMATAFGRFVAGTSYDLSSVPKQVVASWVKDGYFK